MSPGLQFSPVAGCLIVQAHGRYLVEHRAAAVKSMAQAAKEQQARALLLDMRRLEGPFKFADRYQLGEAGGRFLNFLPVGCLLRPDMIDRENIGQVVANNRGARVELFTDEAAAQAWFKQFQMTGTEPAG